MKPAISAHFAPEGNESAVQPRRSREHRSNTTARTKVSTPAAVGARISAAMRASVSVPGTGSAGGGVSRRNALPMFCSVPTLALLASIATSVRAEVPTYDVVFLGAGWTGTGLNERGDACGTGTVGGFSRAGVSRAGAPFEPLPLPAGMVSSRAHDLNDAGVVVGAVCPNEFVTTQPTAAVWWPREDGGYDAEVLGVLPGDVYSGAYAVNDLGDIIGASGFWGWNPDHGVLFTPDGPEPLPGGFLGGDLNDERVIASGNRLLDLDTGEITTLPLPSGNWQGVVSGAINENGDICGYIAGYSSCSIFPIRYRHGVGWEFLGGCATTASSATAMNDQGDALQYYYPTAAGVSFVDEGYHMLASLIPPEAGEYYVQYGGANGINGSRQILAAARQGASGPIGAILMTPQGAAGTPDLPMGGEGTDLASVRLVPNPSSDIVILEGATSTAADETWGVFDASGRQLAAFIGRSWDGRGLNGEAVPSGVYFVRPVGRETGPALRLVRR